MLNKILLSLLGGAIVVAAGTGIFFRQTYTNVTAEANPLEHFSVALWDFDMSPNLIESMRKELPKSKSIIRVSANGAMDYTFKNNIQFVEIEEVYRSSELKRGDQIGVMSTDWCLFFDNMSANLNFINVMQPGEEYLIFLDEQLETLDPEEKIYLLPEFIIPPIFNYQDKDHTILSVTEDDRYVPYVSVKDNEFFVSSDEALAALMALKHELLEQYPK
ncbi:hypothetical protein [Amphibacillus sediminis]|uniref:hypothetical protein n=1 Tax=Amphibacillus sediminis TaxID=360185 RepID=UPI0012EE299E|nr:hypothetical protein [Amphibacillus sediminis]